MELLRDWFRRHFSNPQVVLLAVLLVVGLAVILLAGRTLAPAIAALVIAYILESPVKSLVRLGLPHRAAVVMVFLGFLGVIAVASVAILPLVYRQLTQLVILLPTILSSAQDQLMAMPEQYPQLIDRAQMSEVMASLRADTVSYAQSLLRFSVGSIASLFAVVAVLFITPFLVFFLLKDRDRLVAWFTALLPEERALAAEVWREVDEGIGAYIRGKVYEIGIVSAVTWAAFTLLGVNFALLLSLITGLSVLIPYVGVVGAAVPVILVALFQFGATGSFAAVLASYAVIQILDGNLLAPLVISEAVDLHPVAVIVAILLFGGIWGFWGVFFAIPLATVAAAVYNAWPRQDAAVEAS